MEPHEHIPPSPKPEDKKPDRTFTENLKQTWHDAHKRLGTGGMIAILLGVIILLMLFSDNDRGHQQYGPMGHGTMMMRAPGGNVWYGANDVSDAMERSWDAMNERMARMEKQMMQPINPVNLKERSTKAVGTSHYSGYQSLDGRTVSYNLEVQDGSLSGTLRSSEDSTLRKFSSDLKKAGLNVEQNEEVLTFSGSSDLLEDTLRILER